MRIRLVITAMALLLGCAPKDDTTGGTRPITCTADAQCAEGEVCFQDGCGNPERNLAVEVVPDARAGLNAQDFEVETFQATQDLELRPPSIVAGVLRRDDQLYAGRVTIRFMGESAIIPGRERFYGGPVTLERGLWSAPVGTGVYSAHFLTADPTIPPHVVRNVTLAAGDSAAVNAVLAPTAQVVKLTGVLARTAKSPALDGIMEVQVVDLETPRALSQRVAVDSATGAFTLYAAPETASKELVGIQATPRDVLTGPAPVPRKLFSVSPKGPLPPLELGDYGQPVMVSGRILGSDGLPIEGATVYLDGKVPGGGHFTSASVKTAADGKFEGLLTLPSDPFGEMVLWAVPPARSSAGRLRAPVTVTQAGGFLKELRCPDRVPVQGQVRRPDGRDFPGVRVEARAVAPLEPGGTLPSVKVETTTDENSSYTLYLDPAVWRLDFIAPEPLPRASRQVTVKAELSSTAGNKIVQVPAFNFSKGRTVTGTIRGFPSRSATELVLTPYASVRFYRVVTVEGRKTAELLAEGVSDGQASYSVVLPTR